MSSELAGRIARLLCVGFSGTEVSPELRELVRLGVRNVVLFARNVSEPRQVLALTQSIKSLSREPIAVAVDQEGGPVRRLRQGFTELPAMRALGEGDAALAERTGMLLGRELRAVGIDWNFAPVLDVDSNPSNPVIGKRAFSSSPARVIELGLALGEGLMKAGVAPCAKHFPGHGDTELDSHLDLPRVSHPLERLERVEMAPFAAAATARFPSIMSAHVVYSALDPELPASMSEKVIRGILRERLGYDGLVVSDDLEMNAIVEHHGIASAVFHGIIAGVDCFLVCHTAERMHAAIDATLHAVEQGQLARELIDAALRRHDAFAQRWVKPAPEQLEPSVLRSDEHLALAATLSNLWRTVEER